MKGFKSKAGKGFEAILTVNNDKVSFKFHYLKVSH
ncbi:MULTISPECIES: topoisomerase C-terminal repeat-containing protein [Bacillales]|uniref:Topoisomerase C-terminal repeat-containing protein n=1 Tax=Robertmurraya beringensis TaxID=641660 RepID=A0ABV6KKQ0_9BACI